MLTAEKYERMHLHFLGSPSEPANCLPTTGDIVQVVREFFNVSEADLKGRGRTMFVVWARHVACYLIRECLGKGSHETATCLGLADHSSVLHAAKVVKRKIESCPLKAQQVCDIRVRIESRWPATTVPKPIAKPKPPVFEEPEPPCRADIERQSKVMSIEERIAMHRDRIERESAKFVPPTVVEAIALGRAAMPGGAESVYQSIAIAFRLSRAVISNRRSTVAADCRSAIVFVLRELGLSYPEIAERVGQCGHSCSIGSYRRAVRLLSAA